MQGNRYDQQDTSVFPAAGSVRSMTHIAMHTIFAIPREQRLPLILATGTFLVGLGTHPQALADVVRLKNGGQIRGEVQEQRSDERADKITVVTLSGATISVDRDEIAFVTPRSLRIEEYETRARAIPDTIDAHWQLAEWAREQHLKGEREEQLEHIVRLDPNHERAQRALGRSLHNGKWMTRHEDHDLSWICPAPR